MPPADGPAPGFDSLYDEAPCGLLLTRGDGAIERANLTFCRWLGYAREALHGRRFQDLLTMGGRIFHQTHWAPLLQMQGSVAEVKLDLKRRDGRTLPMMLNAVRRERDGVAWHELALFVAEDRNAYERELMIARKRAEDAHNALRESELRATDRALLAEQMIGIVSHDLRNPLSAILMGAGVLQRAKLDEPFPRAVHHIEQSGRRAKRMIEDLLDFTMARIGRGIAVNVKPVDLHRVVAGVVDELQQANAPRAIEHHAHGEGECRADPDRLYQLVGNLVTNALSYGDPARTVTVSTHGLDDRLEVRVHNRGPVIPPALMPTLFQPMVRGEHTATHMRSVGLGLYIVSEIARAHGGQVRAESTAQAGTTFVATFPRGDAMLVP